MRHWRREFEIGLLPEGVCHLAYDVEIFQGVTIRVSREEHKGVRLELREGFKLVASRLLSFPQILQLGTRLDEAAGLEEDVVLSDTPFGHTLVVPHEVVV